MRIIAWAFGLLLTALFAWLLGWRGAIMGLCFGATLIVYLDRGWERAWAVGLVSAGVLAMVIGGSLAAPNGPIGDFLLAGLISLVPVAIAAWMMFEIATEVLIIWKGGERAGAGGTMFALLSASTGRLRVLFNSITERFIGIQIVSDSRVVYSKPPSKSIRVIGPGLVVIDAGNAVVFERNGKISRVSGPAGLIKTEPYEVMKEIVDLGLQTKTMTSSDEVLTKDGITIAVTFTVCYRIMGDEAALVEDGTYVVDDRVLRRAVLTVDNWKDMTERMALTVVKDILAEYPLDALYDPRHVAVLPASHFRSPSALAVAPRVQIQERLRCELDRQARAWGVEVTRITLDGVRMHPKVRQRLLEHWDLPWRRIVVIQQAVQDARKLLIKAETQAEAMVMQAGAEAQTESIKEYVKVVSEARSRLEAAETRQLASATEAQIKGIEARAKADARLLELRVDVMAEAERFERVLAAIQEVAGKDKMAELTQELIRVLTSVNDVQAVVRMLGFGRRAMLPGPDGQGPDAADQAQSFEPGGNGSK